MQGGVSEKTLGGVSEKTLGGISEITTFNSRSYRQMASKECAKPKGKKRRSHGQRDKYHCLHRHAVKMTSLSGSSYPCEQLFSRIK